MIKKKQSFKTKPKRKSKTCTHFLLPCNRSPKNSLAPNRMHFLILWFCGDSCLGRLAYAQGIIKPKSGVGWAGLWPEVWESAHFKLIQVAVRFRSRLSPRWLSARACPSQLWGQPRPIQSNLTSFSINHRKFFPCRGPIQIISVF